MTSRLHAAWQRLYLIPTPLQAQPHALCLEQAGQVRALVLSLARPADWSAIAQVWAGAQTDLGLPAPGIVVDGEGAYQLWFSVDTPIPASTARAFLQGLCDRYLPEVQPGRLSLWPAPGKTADTPWQHATLAPALQPEHNDGERWSAFVAPDLAPVFADTPWLDIPPGDDNQADLIGHLKAMRLADFQQALAQLEPAHPHVPVPAPELPPPTASTLILPPNETRTDTSLHAAQRTACSFLLDVVQDPSMGLALRIDAARALLHAPAPPPLD